MAKGSLEGEGLFILHFTVRHEVKLGRTLEAGTEVRAHRGTNAASELAPHGLLSLFLIQPGTACSSAVTSPTMGWPSHIFNEENALRTEHTGQSDRVILSFGAPSSELTSVYQVDKKKKKSTTISFSLNLCVTQRSENFYWKDSICVSASTTHSACCRRKTQAVLK